MPQIAKPKSHSQQTTSDHRGASVLVSTLAQLGLKHAVISPGSRNAPLIIALEGNPNIKTHIVIDERAAAHVALGIALKNGTPSIVVCTSGTAAVMSLARYFAELKSNKRSLLFVLFSAEEMGLLGSKYLAKQLKSQGTNIYTVLNFEMIGVPIVCKDYKTYLTGYESSNMAQLINEYSAQNLVGFLPQAKAYQLFQRSDNFPFYVH